VSSPERKRTEGKSRRTSASTWGSESIPS
jgi:hypothetical protein